MESRNESETLTVIEWFSGIGGWSAALKGFHDQNDKFSFHVAAAIDINPNANEVFQKNNRLKPISKIVESVGIEYLNAVQADMWVMSPPCQPFTRNHERDDLDTRLSALAYLTDLLPKLLCPPKYFALENVVGFEESPSCHNLLAVLRSLGYKYSQHILSPTQLGIPNERPRYYLTAVRGTSFDASTDIVVGDSIIRSPASHYDVAVRSMSKIQEFLEHGLAQQQLEELLVPTSVLEKNSAWCLDIVDGNSVTSACFTKAYSRYLKGTGSVLLVDAPAGSSSSSSSSASSSSSSSSPSPISIHLSYEESCCKRSRTEVLAENSSVEVSASLPSDSFASQPSSRTFESTWKDKLNGRRLRYFSPTELVRLFGFPEDFQFPDHLNNRKRYELIGNSVNVTVITYILQKMLCTST